MPLILALDTRSMPLVVRLMASGGRLFLSHFLSLVLDSLGNGNFETLNGSAGYGPGLFGQGLSLNGASGTED